ncbi:MAG: sigma-54-dependent Fis family transcriptional regulator [Acidobacteria bacterium]|nr:MAG: sigma-54-dependent Fis family transcriptional regulator [Acidobacteriota bacterium]
MFLCALGVFAVQLTAKAQRTQGEEPEHMKTGQPILIIDDDASLCQALAELLGSAGYEVKTAETGAAALEVVRQESIGLALLDIRLGAESGLDVLPQIKMLRPEMSVIILTALGTVENAVAAMRRGADNFIVKPIDPSSFLVIVEKGLEACSLRRKAARLQRLTSSSRSIIFGQGSAMSDVLRLAEAVATRETTVLLRGETGTGKGVLARLIHEASPRKKEPFVELNCAGLQRDLTESELFGHERGAFTGAVDRKIGLFEAAEGGTLFLDEVGELDAAVQAKLLRVLEQKRFRRLGGVADIEVDVRLIAATNRDLEQDVAEGRFRQDLWYRLNVFTIELPPLRERRQDILPLAYHFLDEFRGGRTSAPRLSPAVEEILLAYDWPGNVRELRNVIERAAILCPPGSEVLPIHLPPLEASREALQKTTEDSPTASDTAPASMSMEEAERRHLASTLNAHDWNLQAAARALGLSRATLYRKIKKYNLSPED